MIDRDPFFLTTQFVSIRRKLSIIQLKIFFISTSNTGWIPASLHIPAVNSMPHGLKPVQTHEHEAKGAGEARPRKIFQRQLIDIRPGSSNIYRKALLFLPVSIAGWLAKQ
jgi:hypothetical protein